MNDTGVNYDVTLHYVWLKNNCQWLKKLASAPHTDSVVLIKRMIEKVEVELADT